MKKLKTWQIVLLVIFYPIGIIVLIYRLVKKAQLKQQAENERIQLAAQQEKMAAEKKAAEEERKARLREEAALYESRLFKVVGVSFKNEDGKSRQTILRKLKFRDPPFDTGNVDLEFKEYEHDGETAVGVYLAGQQVGNISKDDLPDFLPRMERFVDCEEYTVTGGGTNEETGEKIKYGLKLRLRFRKG